MSKKVQEKKKKLVPVLTRCDEIKVGDILRTSQGDLPVSAIMKSYNFGGVQEYVCFKKDCFSKDYPVRDVNVTGPHPLSVGYLNNEDLNNGIKDEDQDDKVFVHIPASEFVGKLPGIVLEKKKVQTQYNFVFDVHCSVNVAGIDVVTHHPSGFQNQRRLQNNEYHDKTVPKKKWKPFYINYETFIKLKPKDMTEKEFIAACLHSDPQKKYHIPSLSPDLNYLRDLIKTVYG